jgi:hypothetical protein
MKISFVFPILVFLCACKTKVVTDKNFDPFPGTANLSYTDFGSLYAEGIDLYAYSNEFGWRLRIDLGNRAIFTGSDGAEHIFNVQPGANMVVVNLDEPFMFTDGVNNMHVRFQNTPFEDRINKYICPYTVDITFNDISYRGCGLNVFDKRINGVWKLQEVAGMPVDKNTMQNTTFIIQADNTMAGAVLFCDSVAYKAVFRGSNVEMETVKRGLMPRCKAKTPNNMPEWFASFREYQLENDSLLVLKDLEERRYGFVRK